MVDRCTLFCSADLEQFRTTYGCAYLGGDQDRVDEVPLAYVVSEDSQQRHGPRQRALGRLLQMQSPENCAVHL